MTTNEKKHIPDLAYLIISALIAWAGCYMFTMRLGIVTSFPVIIVTAMAAALLKLDALKTTAFYGLFGFMLPFINSRGLKASVLLCALSVIFSALSFASVYCFKRSSGKKILFKSLAALSIILSLTVHFYINSDPVTFYKKSSLLEDYMKKNYKYEKIDVSNTYYDFGEKRFVCEIYYIKKP